MTLTFFHYIVTSSFSPKLFNHKRFIRKLIVEMGVEPIDLLINLGLKFGKVEFSEQNSYLIVLKFVPHAVFSFRF